MDQVEKTRKYYGFEHRYGMAIVDISRRGRITAVGHLHAFASREARSEWCRCGNDAYTDKNRYREPVTYRWAVKNGFLPRADCTQGEAEMIMSAMVDHRVIG